MRAYLDKKAILFLTLVTVPALGDDVAARDKAMKAAFQSLLNLQVMAATPEKFSSPGLRDAIDKDLAALAAVTHEFKKGEKRLDPVLAATLASFADQLQETREELKKGNATYARSLARSAATYCFGCHSRLPDSTGFEDASRRIEALDVSPFRKAEFFAATRQADRALDLYKKILLGKPEDGMDAVEYGRALRHFVLLQVRVKQDPDGLVFHLAKIGKRKDLPDFIRTLASSWETDAKFWRDNDRLTTSELTAEALLKNAKRLIERGGGVRLFAADNAGEVSYLRATGYLHEALVKGLKGTDRGTALYLLGEGYRRLEDPAFTGLDSALFETCVRENPKTEIARQCFRAYLREFLRDPDRATVAERKRIVSLRKLAE